MLIDKDTLLFVILRFLWYSLTVRNEHCQEEMKTQLRYEGEVQKADNPEKIHCKKFTQRTDSPELCDCWGAQRLVVSLKGTHTDFISLQCTLMTPWYFWQVPITCLPAAACVKHSDQMCCQSGEPEFFLRQKPEDIEVMVRKHYPKKPHLKQG